MAQKDVEVILMRQLASYLAVPIFLVDPAGNLIFYNEPAERLLGRRFTAARGDHPASLPGIAFCCSVLSVIAFPTVRMSQR